MLVYLKNPGLTGDTWELFDDVAKTPLSNATIAGGLALGRQFEPSDAGYANFRARRLGNTTWTRYELVSEGQERILD